MWERIRPLQQTKYMTLAGATLAVLTSSLLYLSILIWIVANVFFSFDNVVNTSTWLNPLTFGVNLDAVLNNVAVVLMCGILKKVRCSSPAVVEVGLPGDHQHHATPPSPPTPIEVLVVTRPAMSVSLSATDTP